MKGENLQEALAVWENISQSPETIALLTGYSIEELNKTIQQL